MRESNARVENRRPHAAVSCISFQPAELCLWPYASFSAGLLLRLLDRDDAGNDHVRLHRLPGREVAKIGSEGKTRTSAEWALYIVGLIATVAVTIFITRIARAALRKKV